MSKTEIDIELTAACNKLRIMIRNEQQARDYAQAWRDMGNTSTIQRRIKNEVQNEVKGISLVIQTNK